MSVTDSSGRTTTVPGNVDFVSYEGGTAYLSIGGELYSLDDLDKVADKKYLDAYALAAEFLNILNKLPDVSLLTIDNKEKVDRLEEIYNGMDDYQKGFLTDDYFEKAEAYIKRMKDITPNPDGDEAPNADGDDTSKTDGSGES